MEEGGKKTSKYKLEEVLKEYEDFQQGLFKSRIKKREIDPTNPLPFIGGEWKGKKVEFDTETDGNGHSRSINVTGPDGVDE